VIQVAAKRVQHVDAQEGYDYWAETYDATPNPVVAMDARCTLGLLAPRPEEQILDAGCGTGRHFEPMILAGSRLVGVDFAPGMLRVAQGKYPQVPLVLADLEQPLPFRARSFDAVLCALVGEHLRDLRGVFRESYAVLKSGGRFVFSVYHPEMAAAGKEANFERFGVEFRLGAYGHTVADYVEALEEAGFSDLTSHELRGDEELARTVPRGARYLDFPVLLILQARKGHWD